MSETRCPTVVEAEEGVEIAQQYYAEVVREATERIERAQQRLAEVRKLHGH